MQLRVVLSKKIEQRIREHGQQTYPHECCGIMVGRLQQGVKYVHGLWPQENEREDRPEDRFFISAEMQLQSELRAMREGVDIVGIYHSHPDHPAEPSRFDQDHALPTYSYIIVSVEQGEPAAFRSWQLTDDRNQMLEETIEYTGE